MPAYIYNDSLKHGIWLLDSLEHVIYIIDSLEHVTHTHTHT